MIRLRQTVQALPDSSLSEVGSLGRLIQKQHALETYTVQYKQATAKTSTKKGEKEQLPSLPGAEPLYGSSRANAETVRLALERQTKLLDKELRDAGLGGGNQTHEVNSRSAICGDRRIASSRLTNVRF